MLEKLKVVAAPALAAGFLALGCASNAQAFNVGTHATPVGSGSMPVTANVGSVSRLVVNGTVPLNCTTASMVGATNTGSYVNTYPSSAVGTFEPKFSTCTGFLGFRHAFGCVSTSQLQVTATPPALPAATLATTAGRISGINCTITFELGCSANLAGTVPVSYINGNGTTVGGKLTVLVAGQSLTVSASTCPAAVLPNGTAQLGAPGSGSGTALGSLTYNVASAVSGHPYISD